MVDLDAMFKEQTNVNFARDALGASALALVRLVTPRRLKVLLRNLIQAWGGQQSTSAYSASAARSLKKFRGRPEPRATT